MQSALSVPSRTSCLALLYVSWRSPNWDGLWSSGIWENFAVAEHSYYAHTNVRQCFIPWRRCQLVLFNSVWLLSTFLFQFCFSSL